MEKVGQKSGNSLTVEAKMGPRALEAHVVPAGLRTTKKARRLSASLDGRVRPTMNEAADCLAQFAQPSVAAELLGVSDAAVRKAIKSNRLGKYKLGGGTLVVSLRECLNLWAGGARTGRPRKSDVAATPIS